MKNQKFDINKLRVASPCSVGWEEMTGDDRVRHCASCQLNIYNFSEMTESEVQKLMEDTEDRICGRLFLRADGTVITKDCPVGLRSLYKRTARFAGATLTAIFALFSFGFGQNQSEKETACKRAGTIFSSESHNLNYIEGTIIDPNCIAVPEAEITLINEDTKRKYKVKSNKNGYYRVLLNSPGLYDFRVEANGFQPYRKNIEMGNSESLQFNVSLDVGGFIGVIVVTDQKSKIDLKSSGSTFKITREIIDKIPH